MIALVQRVTAAGIRERSNPSSTITHIEKGMVVFLGFEPNDTALITEQMVLKLRGLRIFADEAGHMNLATNPLSPSFLFLSQFTLYADCKYGNRPSFTKAAPKPRAQELYITAISNAQRLLGEENVKSGQFGGDYLVDICNDGPVTLWLDSSEIIGQITK